MTMADKQFLETLSRRLADDGKLIEAGWVAMRLAVVPLDAPAVQLETMRLAYMAGAQHLFASIVAMLEPGQTETEADLRRMDLISKELDAFADELKLRHGKQAGSA